MNPPIYVILRFARTLAVIAALFSFALSAYCVSSMFETVFEAETVEVEAEEETLAREDRRDASSTAQSAERFVVRNVRQSAVIPYVPLCEHSARNGFGGPLRT